VDGRRLDIRLTPTFRRGEVQADVVCPLGAAEAHSPEVSLGARIVAIVGALRAAVPELRDAVMAYLSEEPWTDPVVIVPSGPPAPTPLDGAARRRTRIGELLNGGAGPSRTVPLYAHDLPTTGAQGRLTGAGRWLEAHLSARGAGATWEEVGTDASNLFLLGQAVGGTIPAAP
jgi:hypothetical protein